MPAQVTITSFHHVGADELKNRWTWFFGLGVALFVLGLIALGAVVFVTLATMVFFGCLLIAAGVLQAVHALISRRWGGHVIDLLTGILSLVVGVLVVTHPEGTAAALTLLIAMFLIFGGAFRIAIAIFNQFNHWIWLLLHGVVNLALGLMIWRQWPDSGQLVIGLFIGIDMLLNGWTLMMLGLLAKKLPTA